VTLLTIFVVVTVLSPLFRLPGPTEQDLRARFSPPTISLTGLGPHPLGTDQLGRDLLSRTVYGGRITLFVASAAVVLGGVVGVLLGLLSGYAGGIVDRIVMRFADAQLAIPLTLLALLVVAAMGPSLQNLIIVLAVVGWIRYARITRGQVLSLRNRDFVQSARAIGASHARIMFQHILPNVMPAAVVVATLELARVIVLEAGLSFLGLGIQPPWPSWGRMLAEGRFYVTRAWWLITFPGVAMMLTVLSVSLVGDWLRDHFDPRMRGRGK
jgi:peptide/nickel transport system permease protein